LCNTVTPLKGVSSWTLWRSRQQDRPTMGSSGAWQLDQFLVVLRWSSCKQMRITCKRFKIGAQDLQVEYSEMNVGSIGVSLKPIAPTM